jgi:hypothetical protein
MNGRTVEKQHLSGFHMAGMQIGKHGRLQAIKLPRYIQ